MSIYDTIDKLFGKKQIPVLLKKPAVQPKCTADIMCSLTQSEKQVLQTYLREELKALNTSKTVSKAMLKLKEGDTSSSETWYECLKYLKKRHNKLAEIQRKLKRSI